ncbi:O-antigen polymerase [Salimicrobium jeotgali]|uniref:O-antigen polymerase n=1 Tax=Salimicrobium jeotgali TaxID=1230341 RepID=UPI000C8267BB|nr:O-antigen polymerase [Salimicrobium jeotgali]
MGEYSIVAAIFIMLIVFIFELIRPKKMKIDFLTACNFIYILAFSISPLYIYWFYEYTTWSTIKENNIENGIFLYGSIISIVFYIFFVWGYYFFGKFKINSKFIAFSHNFFDNFSNKRVLMVGTLLLVIGGGALLVYIQALGGLSQFLTLGSILRSNGDYIDSPFLFLKNVAPLLTVSAFIYYALYIDGRPRQFKYLLLFIIAFAGSLLILFHSAGRMSMFVFLVTFPIAHTIYKNNIKVSNLIIGLLLFFFIVTFGDQLMNATSGLNTNLEIKNFGETVGGIFEEFTFPFTNIANTVALFPVEYDYRYGFKDLLGGLENILPSAILDLSTLIDETPSQLNTRIFNSNGTMPVDIITFGYMSFGIAGVMLTGLAFGVLTKSLESLFSHKKSLLACIFFTSWMIFISFRFMYGDPALAYESAFKLVIGTILLYSFASPGVLRRNSITM